MVKYFLQRQLGARIITNSSTWNMASFVDRGVGWGVAQLYEILNRNNKQTLGIYWIYDNCGILQFFMHLIVSYKYTDINIRTMSFI